MKDFWPPAFPFRGLIVRGLIAVVGVVAFGFELAEAEPIDFGRDVRPILSDRCFKCHGPDTAERQADLRLDQREAALAVAESGETTIVPGRPEESELFRRLITKDEDQRMPPAGHGPALTETEIATLRQWIAEGAEYAPHWAFVSPTRPELPSVKNNTWPRGKIDRFVLGRLEREGISPAKEADRRVLVRRVFFDLIGIPPTIEEVEAFVRDEGDDAYERLVDRLLASPHYGERMAQDWLDLARYSDTTGFAADSPRSMWLFRDWVIKAFNDNMPFDQFTIEQLAGDMLPNATVNQKIATGFHRNSMQALGNNPRKEEFRVKGIVDRVNTTGRTWLGLTVSCAECHDHKFDPVSQEEYYQLFAIFNNIPHYGKAFTVRGPRMNAIAPLAEARRAQIEKEIAELKKEIVPYRPKELGLRYGTWEAGARQQLLHPNTSTEAAPLVARWPLAEDLNDQGNSPTTTTLRADSGSDTAPATGWTDGPAITKHKALLLADKQYLRVEHSDKLSAQGDMTITAWIKTTSDKADIVCKWDSVRGQRSFVFGIGGEGEQNATPGNLYAWTSAEQTYFKGQQIYGSIPVNDGRWHHVAMVFHAGDRIDLYVDGVRDARVRRSGNAPERLAAATCDLVIGGGYSLKPDPSSYFLKGAIADVRIIAAAAELAATVGRVTPEIRDLLDIELTRHTDAQGQQLANFFNRMDPGDASEEVKHRLTVLHQELDFLAREHEAQTMLEMDEARDTHIHIRGDYLAPGEQVNPGVPAFLPSLAEGEKADRLSFARWLVSGEHPLTARVAVNRIWQHYFGTGLVKTADDFGLQGDWPSHPQLLDWLAVEFVESGWDMKALHRRIVTSATYRQSAAATPEAYERDHDNRLLARGPRMRLPAEQIRDQALAVAGLLSDKLGGPSVHPEQPAGLFEEKAQTMYHPTWVTSSSPERYRRGVYVYWKRMNLYPTMAIFDAPTRERCRVTRAATNTPLQALVLLNDPVYLEAASGFADRILADATNDLARIDYAIHRCLGRPSSHDERLRYAAFVERQRQRYTSDPAAAAELSGGIESAGDASTASKPAKKRNQQQTIERAAWTTLASLLLNLDETISKP